MINGASLDAKSFLGGKNCVGRIFGGVPEKFQLNFAEESRVTNISGNFNHFTLGPILTERAR